MSAVLRPVLPDERAPGGKSAFWKCGEMVAPGRQCPTVVQGGRIGLELHRRVVHPNRETARA